MEPDPRIRCRHCGLRHYKGEWHLCGIMQTGRIMRRIRWRKGIAYGCSILWASVFLTFTVFVLFLFIKALQEATNGR